MAGKSFTLNCLLTVRVVDTAKVICIRGVDATRSVQTGVFSSLHGLQRSEWLKGHRQWLEVSFVLLDHASAYGSGRFIDTLPNLLHRCGTGSPFLAADDRVGSSFFIDRSTSGTNTHGDTLWSIGRTVA